MAAEVDPIDVLTRTSSLVQGMLERCARAHGLSLIQARLLGVLRDRKPTINELARLLDLDKSSTSGLVDRAERRGLLRRLPSQIDRRSVRVSLTVYGRGLVSSAAADYRQDLNAVFGRVSPEDRAALARVLSEVLTSHAAGQGMDFLDTEP